MKKSIFAIVVFAITVLFTNDISAQKFSGLDKSPADISLYPRKGNTEIKVVYSRPQLKGRALEKLAPADKVWRTGANEAAEITFYKNVVFGGKKVKAGTYTLFTIPGANEWTVILNKANNVWGAYSYDKKQDVARVKGAVSKSASVIEAFSVAIGKVDGAANLYLGWGNTIVTVPVK